MYKMLIVIYFVFCVSAIGQNIDTTAVKNLVELDSQIDSLRYIIRTMDNELQNVKHNMVAGKTDIDELIALLNDEEPESVNADSRSRRKRVDVLLQAITQRPGQLRFNGGATAIFQSGLSNEQNRTSATGSFDIYAHTAFGENTLLFFDIEAIGGNGPNDIYSTTHGLNADAGSTQDEDGTDRLTVLEAWAEFSLLNKILTINAGKIDLTNYFDNNASANDETVQFISNVFVNNAAFAVPNNSPGIRLRSTLFNRLYIQMGLVSAYNSGNDIFKNVYKIFGIGYTFLPATDFESNIRFYSYSHPLAENKMGWGLSFDKVLFGAYNIFARFGKNESKLSDFWGIHSSWSTGTRFVTQISGQITVFGIAFGKSQLKSNLRYENNGEIYARIQLNKWTHLSLHYQKIWNAAGTSEQFDFVGLRTHFNF